VKLTILSNDAYIFGTSFASQPTFPPPLPPTIPIRHELRQQSQKRIEQQEKEQERQADLAAQESILRLRVISYTKAQAKEPAQLFLLIVRA